MNNRPQRNEHDADESDETVVGKTMGWDPDTAENLLAMAELRKKSNRTLSRITTIAVVAIILVLIIMARK